MVFRGSDQQAVDCADATARLLIGDPARTFVVTWVGPAESVKHIDAAALAGADLYVQPGGGDDTVAAAAELGPEAPAALGKFVRAGGRYLGICLGAYLAAAKLERSGNGATVGGGLGLLAGDEPLQRQGDDDNAHIFDYTWLGVKQALYYQSGPSIPVPAGAEVLATARNEDGSAGPTVALATRLGAGLVCVVGPHPEADASWYDDAHLTMPVNAYPGPGRQLIAKIFELAPVARSR
ncbi:BPL-N domain-containing protein [Streptomyces sp. H10-C2]|uniref:BPL-N domain-containing protein n=1 Tax=unclassified Streptomyces TaxID=2593676 RepID=UPI0024B9FE61|nr:MULTISPECIES: BPL-N domain-containing protein [unclassified Streptomyces]MDJ0346454.1 BPL-N domain-containing protein [Streptomyces sp. PH10-H1]MDJ0374393.1 BPL-N domain-containing protein [Streptomyces sp. H10-C2]